MEIFKSVTNLTDFYSERSWEISFEIDNSVNSAVSNHNCNYMTALNEQSILYWIAHTKSEL